MSWSTSTGGYINDPNLVVIGSTGVSGSYADGGWTARKLTLTKATGTITTNGTLIGNGTCQAQPALTLTGIAGTGSTVAWAVSGALPASWQTGIVPEWAVASNTVTLSLCNGTGANITPAAATVNVRVIN